MSKVKTKTDSKKNGYSRRDFLKVVGATGGAAAAGCAKQPVEKIIPYVNQPNEVIPGVASWYAGSCNECTAGCGVLVRTREGRAVKVEGNPAHPLNKGGLCAIGQSSLQTLYDPDRVREPLLREVRGSYGAAKWEDALEKLKTAVEASPKDKKVVLLARDASGSLEQLVGEMPQAIPGFTFVRYGDGDRESVDEAAAATFGSGVRPHFDFSKAEVIASFGAGYLETWLSPVAFSKQWAETRRVADGKSVSYAIHFEPRLSLTAANADRWVKNAPASEPELLRGLLKLLADGRGLSSLSPQISAAVRKATAGVDVAKSARAGGVPLEELEKLSQRLLHAGTSLVVAGGASVGNDNQVTCGVLANLINVVLGNVGKTVILEELPPATVNAGSIEELIEDMKAGNVSSLIMAGVNPQYTLSATSGFREAITKVAFVAALATNLDESASIAQLVMPASTSFESWSDGSPLPGVMNLSQPAMQPLYESMSVGDLLISLAGKLGTTFGDAGSFYDYIRLQWKKRLGEADFEAAWTKAVQAGGDLSAAAPASAPVRIVDSAGEIASQGKHSAPGLHVVAFPTVRSKDGSSANRAWLQEIPDPISTTVWGSWVEMHPALAKKYALSSGDVVSVATSVGGLKAPVIVTDHIHENAVAIPLGGGHERMGRFADGVGVNPITILPAVSGRAQAASLAADVTVRKSPLPGDLVQTQMDNDQRNRGIIRWVPGDDLGEQHGYKPGHHPSGETDMYHQMEHPLYKWGMTVDLSSCTGCSACVVACYAENNVPVVGKELTKEGREMSWVRVSRYFSDDENRPVDGFLPMMCQHCNNAPCEPVCPVYATYHNEEGLNHMVYNRCVGTRYCSNNCSYKVRRFNWFKYDWPEPMTWQLNPDVTVREVGVMEKCTFCVQRIKEGQNNAKNEGRPVRDGEISPACASSCPTGAITFGNLLDTESAVSKGSADVRAYKVLDSHLNTQPAISYLARVVHPSAVKEKPKHGHGKGHH